MVQETQDQEVSVNGAKPSHRNSVVEVPQISVARMDITLIGDSALIVHAWSEKAKQQMLDKQMKKAKQAKEAKDPEQQFQDSLYKLDDNKYGFPAVAFKASAVAACRDTDMKMTAARGRFHIDAEMIEIHGSEPRPREDMVRIAMGTADIRYRGEFIPWWVVLPISYNDNAISPAQIINLFNVGGFGVGVGEWRPSTGGSYGRFHVASEEEVQRLSK